MLGGILLDASELGECASLVRPEDLYVPANGKVFAAMLALDARGQPVDRVAVVEELQRSDTLSLVGGPEYVDELDKVVPVAANLAYYAKIIRDKAQARELINCTASINGLAYEQHGEVQELLDESEQRIMAIRGTRDLRGGFIHSKPLIATAFKSLEELYERGEEITGVATGLSDLDRMTAGLQPGDLVILAARPSMGKTALSLDWIREVASRVKYRDQRCSAGIFSLEMPKEQLIIRMLSAESGVDGSRMRTGKLIDSDWAKLANAAGTLADAQIHVDDTASITMTELRARARRLAARAAKTDAPLRMVAVDYLQLLGGDAKRGSQNESREREVAENSRQLKLLAKELGITVVALSQLNRKCEERKDKRPLLSDLRDSGAIEQDADVIVFLYRHEVYEKDDQDSAGKAELIIAKQRNGPIGVAHVAFLNHLSSFRNLQRGGDHP
jgi:replicative DNA helicase